MTQEERIEELCDELKSLLIRKNRDYDDSFSKQFAKYGVLSGLIRIDDKINRLHSLTEGGRKDSVGESLIDTCIDAAGYFLLTAVELNKKTE